MMDPDQILINKNDLVQIKSGGFSKDLWYNKRLYEAYKSKIGSIGKAVHPLRVRHKSLLVDFGDEILKVPPNLIELVFTK